MLVLNQRDLTHDACVNSHRELHRDIH